MKVFIKGMEIELDKNDYVASGGEGEVYIKGNQAFKIYHEKSKMIPSGKISELSVLKHPNIIKPENIICDRHGSPIGYTMKTVKDHFSLCQLFTKAFRDRNGLTNQTMFELVKSLQDIVSHVHEKGLLVVDLNEFNFLVGKDFKDVFAIDVDSYQCPSYPATALMESVRDRHSSTFTKGSDWFSFAIVSFQMFIGVHPYKGNYPGIKDMNTRMLKNISVLNPKVSIPKVCYDFKVIPSNWLSWYKAVLEEGKRLQPPTEGEVLQIMSIARQIVGSDNLDITLFGEYNSKVLAFVNHNGNKIVFTRTSVYLNDKEIDSLKIVNGSVVGFTNKMSYPIIAHKTPENKISFFNAFTKTVDEMNVECSDLMSYDGRIYAKSKNNILEVKFLELGTKVIYSTKKVGSCLENGTTVFQGTIVQNMLESWNFSLFPKADTCYQVFVHELKGYKIVEAKYYRKILMVVASLKGKYDRFIFKFNDAHDSYSVQKVVDITPTGLNFTVLDNGICVNINEEEKLELFMNDKNTTDAKIVEDKAINGDNRLYKDGNTVLFAHEERIFKMKMK